MPSSPKRLPFWLGIVLGLFALAGSSVLLVDYVRHAPVLCDGAGSGCGSIREHSGLGYPFGVPLPVFGIAGLLAVVLASLVPGRRARIAQAAIATGGAIVAIGLIGWQIAHRTFCPYCLVVDGSMVVLAALSVLRALRAWDPPAGRLEPGLAVLALLLATSVPAAVGFQMKPKIVSDGKTPEVILAEISKAPRGKVTIVDFIDFECPYCRMTHKELAPVVAAHADAIHLVRKHVPLRMHPHAMDAAKAACCAEELGKGDEMADALVLAPVEELTREGCEQIAAKQGLDVARFRACVAAPETEARIKADGETFRAAKGHGLPTLFVGTQRLDGAQDGATLRAVVEGAVRAL